MEGINVNKAVCTASVFAGSSFPSLKLYRDMHFPFHRHYKTEG